MSPPLPHKNQRSFTMTELLMVVVVMAVLASLALPNLNFFLERMRAQEMVPQLLGVYQAQKEHLHDYGTYPTPGLPPYAYLRLAQYIELPPSNPATNFRPVEVKCGDPNKCPGGGGPQNTSCQGPSSFGFLAQTVRWQNGVIPHPIYNYTLYMLEDGRVVCEDLNAFSCLGFCERLGFEPY